MPLYPYFICPWFEQRFFLPDGTPNAGGYVTTYVAATTDEQVTYTDAEGNAEHTNPIHLDVDGRPPSPIFIAPIGMKFLVEDADHVELYTVDLVEDSGAVFSGQWGVLLGSPTVFVNGEVIPATCRYARINSASGSTTVYVVAAADMTQPLTIKNMGGNAVTVTADGVDTFESGLTTLTIPAAATPVFPAILLASDGISNISILSSHGMS